MFTEEAEGEDTVRRGTDDADTEPQVPVVDVFDELLGITPTKTSATTTTAAPTTTSTVPPWSTPSPVTTVSNSGGSLNCNSARVSSLVTSQQPDLSLPVNFSVVV